MKKQILYMLCATALLSSCHIYKSYDRPEDITTSGLYRDPVADNDTLVSDTANFGNLPGRILPFRFLLPLPGIPDEVFLPLHQSHTG